MLKAVTGGLVAGAIALALASVSSPATGRAVTLDVSVSGEGTLTAAGGIDCGQRCDARYRSGRVVTVTATPSTNAEFVGWGADCRGTAPACSVLLENATRVRAVFSPILQKVSMTVGGPGTVVSDPVGLSPVPPAISEGIECGSQGELCAAMFGQGRTIILTPRPDAGAVFAGWGRACEGQPVEPVPRCALTVGANAQVTNLATAWFRHRVAGFGPQTVTVDAYRGRNVRSSPRGIACGDVCSAAFTSRTTISLSAQGSDWSGDCVGGVDPCIVVADAPVRVAARVQQAGGSSGPVTYGVNVSVSGRGRVTVGSRITCDGKGGRSRKCDAGFAPNKSFTLLAKPANRRNRFVKWTDPFCTKAAGTKPRCRMTAFDNLKLQAVFTDR